MSDKELELQEMDELKSQLDLLGIRYHHNAKLETLQKLLQDFRDTQTEDSSKEVARSTSRTEVLAPMLVKVTCVNPHKSSWRGEKLYFGNSVVGRCVDFVPYNTGDNPEPIWLPKMLVNMLKERRYLSTAPLKRNEIGIDGVGHRTAWKPEFIVEVVKEG